MMYSTEKDSLLVVRIDQSIAESIHWGKQEWKGFCGAWSSSLVSVEPFLVVLSYDIFKVDRFLSSPLPLNICILLFTYCAISGVD